MFSIVNLVKLRDIYTNNKAKQIHTSLDMLSLSNIHINDYTLTQINLYIYIPSDW
jgi:hypothetical protein